MKRRWAFAAITLLSLVVFAPPLLRNEVFSIRDHDDYFQPLRWFTASELRHGRLPLWNAYNGSGEPWLANPQTGIFYPPTWLFVVLPFTAAYTLYLFGHAVLLGCGAYLLFARLTRPGGAALAAALALTFCGPVMSLLDAQNNLTTFAWIPLILWCALTGVSARASALAIAMSFLAGEPFYAAVGALLFAIVRRRGLRDLIEVTLTSFALASIQLLPFLSMVRSSDRANGGVSRAVMFKESMPLADWLRIAIPPNLSSPPFDPHLGQHFILIVYVGMFTVAFALAGLVIGRQRAVGWMVLAVVSALIAMGDHLAPTAWVLAHLPLTLFRYPSRLVPVAALAICALAAIGSDQLIRGRWQLVIALLMFADVVLQIQPLLITTRFNPNRVTYPRSIGRDAKMLRIDQPLQYDREAWISGYLNLYDRRFELLTPAPILSQRYADRLLAAEARSSEFDTLSVGYYFAPRTLPGLQPVARFHGVVVHRSWSALPLAYSRDDISHRLAPVRSLAFTPAAVFLSVDLTGDSDVTVSQLAAPGWRVAVDGKAATPHEGTLFREVHVTRGHHEIAWTYRPLSLIIGAVFTLIALVRLLSSREFVKRVAHLNFFARGAKNA